MGKRLLLAAAMGVLCGTANAQSSVTLYGTVDLNGHYVKNDGTARVFTLGQDGLNFSQLGFRAIEDLGGGLKAGILLLAGVNSDTGTANAKFWSRRSTISLYSPAGELRLGRDYNLAAISNTYFDTFGALGVGNALNVFQRYAGTRQDNAISYLLPQNLGGWYGQAMVAAGEGGTSGDWPGRYLGTRVGFASGPFDVVAVVAQQRYDRNFASSLAGDEQHTYNFAGKWDFGFAKVLAVFDREQLSRGVHENRGTISASVPIGLGEIHAGYDLSKLDKNGPTFTVDQVKAGYVYNLSKRTALYGTGSFLRNKDATSLFIPGGNTVGAKAGGDSRGFELGLRHFF